MAAAIFVLDGIVDIETTMERMSDKRRDFFLAADGVADAAFALTGQDSQAWTFELDLRPYGEIVRPGRSRQSRPCEGAVRPGERRAGSGGPRSRGIILMRLRTPERLQERRDLGQGAQAGRNPLSQLGDAGSRDIQLVLHDDAVVESTQVARVRRVGTAYRQWLCTEVSGFPRISGQELRSTGGRKENGISA